MSQNIRKNIVLTTLAVAAAVLAAVPPAELSGDQNRGAGAPQTPPASPTVVYAPMTAKPGGPIAPRPSSYKVDAIEFLLIPKQAVEYKFRLDKGAVMVYSWKADQKIRFDFHTIPDGKPISASQRFEAAEKDQAHGIYTAPYPGLHGWWWENSSNDTVIIKLTAAGFFTEAVMFSDGEQIPFEVQDPPPPAEP